MVAFAAISCLAWGLPASAQASPPPSVFDESVSHITEHDATLDAQINTYGLYTAYEFQIDTNGSYNYTKPNCPLGACDSISVGEPLPAGLVEPKPEYIPAGSGDQSVSLDLASIGATLQPGTTYHYKVIASNYSGPTIEGPDQTFTTPSAGTAPVIDSVSVSHLTPTDATLEGQINSEGLSTMYEFRMTYTRCRECMSPTYNIPLPSGLLLGSFQDQSVSVDLNSVGVTLKPGFYEYSLSATSAGGSTEAPGGSFEPPGGVFEPLSTTTSTSSGAGQPAGINTNTGNQPAGSGGSPAPGVTPRGSQIVCLCNCTRGCHGKKVGPNHLTQTQKLSKALKACDKKPKKQRPSCKRQARLSLARAR